MTPTDDLDMEPHPPLVHEDAEDSSRMICFLAICVVCAAPCVAIYLLCR